jgi:hypothetical protein
MLDHKVFLDTIDRYANAIPCIGLLLLVIGGKMAVLVFVLEEKWMC